MPFIYRPVSSVSVKTAAPRMQPRAIYIASARAHSERLLRASRRRIIVGTAVRPDGNSPRDRNDRSIELSELVLANEDLLTVRTPLERLLVNDTGRSGMMEVTMEAIEISEAYDGVITVLYPLGGNS